MDSIHHVSYDCIYACSLDSEGAFDAVPHSILFYKAMDVIPDHRWLILVNWYKSITVQIKHVS